MGQSLTLQIQEMSVAMNQLKETVTLLKTQMDGFEEKKSDDGDLQKQIDEIQRNMKRHMMLSGGKVEESKTDKFRTWIEDTVGLPEYYSAFEENGADDLEVAQMFTMKELSMIGITKIGHRMRILKAIGVLNQPSNSPPVAAPAPAPAAAPSPSPKPAFSEGTGTKFI